MYNVAIITASKLLQAFDVRKKRFCESDIPSLSCRFAYYEAC
jgi:hypothetical protein